ncbi:MAG: response regulator transcription factor [Cocleimonas sp.]|nr:response regulator transcription factor [Cocleimonas sp.]
MTPKKTYKIILVEDDAELANMIQTFLTSEGFDVIWVDNGLLAVDHILSDKPDLVVLDIMLPGLDGVEVCRQIRQDFNNPVLMLTAKDDDFSEVSSLNTGADGYLNKPVRPHILLAHINALLRRNQSTSVNNNVDKIHIQNLTINLKAYTLHIDDQEINLTSGEFELLSVLVKSNGIPVSRDDLYQQLRGIEYDGIDRSIDLRVSSLRKKMDDDIPPYRFIKTVRSKGYLLVV